MDQANVLAFLVEPDAIDLLNAYATIGDGQLRCDALAIVRSAARINAGSSARSV